MIAIITLGAYWALFYLMLGAVGIVLEICTALREAWCENEDEAEI